MPLSGPCITGPYPVAASTKPLALKVFSPGACKFAGFNTFAGKAAGAGFATKGMCLGLGLGFGIWGPLLLLGAGTAGCYFFLKNHNHSRKDSSEEAQ